MRNTKIIWRMIAVVAIAALAAACSDGELKVGGGASINPPPPVIKVFKADPPQVEVGGSTTLYWEVEDADSIEMASAPEGMFQFHAGPFEDLTGSTQVDGITDTTDFILTASKTVVVATPSENTSPAAFFITKSGQIPLPGEPTVPTPSENPTPAGPVTSQAIITVAVVAASECSIDITSDAGDAPVNAGEPTTISWTATPDTAVVTVTASDGTTVADTFPIAGSATVTPNATTTYTAKAECADGQEKTDEVIIQVTAANITAKIKANDQETLVTVPNFTEQVKISYEATPASAQVTVAADKPVTCTPELPNNAVLAEGKGESQCTLTGDTRFDMTAKVGEAEGRAAVVVALQGGQMADALVSADPWAFEGEKVTVTADPDAIAGNNRALIKEIKVAGRAYPLPATGPLVVRDVAVPAGGIDVFVVSVNDIEVPHPKVVQAVTPITMVPSGDIVEFSKIVFDSANPSLAYIGVKKAGYCQGTTCGHVYAYKSNIKNVNDYTAMDIDIGSILLATAEAPGYWSGGDGAGFFEMVKDYPVSAIAADESRIFVGTTGALVYSEDGGKNWNRITTFLRFKSLAHPTCGGDTQPGNGNDLGSLGRACDLIARDNHLVIATDRGVLTVTDVDNFIKTRDASKYVAGRPPEGAIDQVKYPTYGAVAHDLEATDGAIYVASKKGLFKSVDDGETWEKIELDTEVEIFAVALDKKDNKIYVGTADSIKSMSLDGGSWETKSIGQKVYSLAADPSRAGTVLAGTSQGLYVTRDKGANWTAVSAGGFEEKAVKTVAIATKTLSADQVEYSISFGGVGGAVADSITVSATPVITPEPPPEEEGGGEETPSP